MCSAIDQSKPSGIQKRDYDFVEALLTKHAKVTRVEPIYDRLLRVHRIGRLRPITIVLINAYELTADEIRHASRTFGSFDVVIKTNPNGNTTEKAEIAAGELSAEILQWRQLYIRLNRP